MLTETPSSAVGAVSPPGPVKSVPVQPRVSGARFDPQISTQDPGAALEKSPNADALTTVLIAGVAPPDPPNEQLLMEVTA